jgi:hypothetical protein
MDTVLEHLWFGFTLFFGFAAGYVSVWLVIRLCIEIYDLCVELCQWIRSLIQ